VPSCRRPAQALFDKYKICTVAIDVATAKGARVTPHLYMTTAELGTLVKARKELAA
jgi:hypothetical protein